MRLGSLLSWLIPLGIAVLVAIAVAAFVLLRRRSGRGAPADLQTLLARVSETPEQDDPPAAPRDLSGPSPPDGDDLGERLLQLEALHESGLIDEADYQARRAQLLSRL